MNKIYSYKDTIKQGFVALPSLDKEHNGTFGSVAFVKSQGENIILLELFWKDRDEGMLWEKETIYKKEVITNEQSNNNVQN